MFGYLRFFLASLVLMSHSGISLQGFNPGVAAVVIFYMLAGFVVCNLFLKVFVSEKIPYFKYICDRALRIFPLYLFIVLLTSIFVFSVGYGSPKFTIAAFINNILIIPLNYYMFIDSSVMQEPKNWLITQAWSLGAELQAYLLLPLVIFSKPFKVVIAISSLCVFVLASLGLMQTDYFGYRLLPGVFFIFILGTMVCKTILNDSRIDVFDKYFPVFTYCSIIILLIILGIKNSLLPSFVRETTLGILLGLPIIFYIAGSKIKAPMNHFLGDLSYGLFLSHFLVIWMIDYYALVDQIKFPFLFVTTVFVLSLIIALLGLFIVEKNIKKYRFRFSQPAGKQ